MNETRERAESFKQRLKEEIKKKEERIEKLLEHTLLFEKTWGGLKNFNILKRFYKIYLNSFPGAAKPAFPGADGCHPVRPLRRGRLPGWRAG